MIFIFPKSNVWLKELKLETRPEYNFNVFNTKIISLHLFVIKVDA